MNYSVAMTKGKLQYIWMLETFGRETRGTRWDHLLNRFYFTNEADKTWFILRWS